MVSEARNGTAASGLASNGRTSNGLVGMRAAAGAFWSARTEQERRFLAVGGIVVGLALVYAVLVDPALTGREQLRKALPQLRQETAEMQALAAQAAQLGAQAPVQVQPLSRERLTAALAARGLDAQNLAVTGDYVKVDFKGVQFAGLVTWLDAVRRDERLAVQEAKIGTQGGKEDSAGLVDATLTLRQEAGSR
ncbi:type II secretion system protein GspM [Pseudoduganella albidiflava]|nr:type II secretion system protein GspM [Pseudoduganella albidiflava]